MRLFKYIVGAVVFTIVASGISSCKKENNGGLFERELEYCDFPFVENIHNKLEKLDIEAIGINDVLVKDSILIVSTQNNKEGWYVYDVKDNKPIIQFLSVGGGPLEVDMPVVGYQTSFKTDKENGHTILSIPQISGNKVIDIDLTSTVKSDSIVGEEVDMQIFSPTTYMTYSLGDNRTITYEVDQQEAGIRRRLFNGNEEVELACLNILNQKKAENIENLISIMNFPIANPYNNKIVELGIYNSSIIVYDCKNGDAYSLTPCNTDNSIKKIDERVEKGEVEYQGGYSCEQFFMVIKPMYDSDSKLTGSNLLFFDWNGNALGKIECGNINIQRASVDIMNGTLYVFDSVEDQILKANISDFLKKFNN